MKFETFRSPKLIAFLLLAAVAFAQDPARPAQPPKSTLDTLNTSSPTLYAQWYTYGDYFGRKSAAQDQQIAALNQQVARLSAQVANVLTLQQIAQRLASIDNALGIRSITITASGSTLTVAWDWSAAPGQTAIPTGYKVERSTDGVNFGQIADVPYPATTYADKGLSPGTYWYRVRAYNATLTSAFSNVASYALN